MTALLATVDPTDIPPELHWSDDSELGLRRVRRGKGFSYVEPGGRACRDEKTLQRVRALAVPPAWTDVWICPSPNGHLQATGRDARGRKQYRYHADWTRARGDHKHSRMRSFGKALGRLRAGVRRDLAQSGLPREKVLALVVKLLDATQVRVGNAEYARSNGSFGLTTLRDRHVRFPARGKALLHFRGKGGAEHEVLVEDARLAKLVRRCQELPGQALFQYVDDEGARRAIDSGQVNDYLRERMGEEFTAKDFRTWHATLHALKLIGKVPVPEKPSERALRACINEVVKEVAAGLRNTPAVCRKSYINPAVFIAWQKGELRRRAAREPPAKALLKLLGR